MSGLLLPAALLLAVVVNVVVVLATVPHRRALVAVDEARLPALARLRRSALRARVVAVVVGAAAVVLVSSALALGRGLLLVPAVFAAAQVVGAVWADVTGRGAARGKGSAGLGVRRVRDALPRGLTLAVALSGAALVALLTWTTAVASPDDLGRAGRSMRYGCTECGPGDVSGAFGPFPGSFYTVPLAVALLVVLALAGAAAWLVVRRPQDGSNPEVVQVDDALRRRSVESVVAAVGLAVSGSLAGIGLLTGPTLALHEDLSGALHATGWTLTVAAVAATSLAVWCLVVLALPGNGRPAGTAAPAARAGSGTVSP